MLLNLDKEDVVDLLQLVRGNDYLEQKLKLALSCEEETIGVTQVRWCYDDIKNEYEDRYGEKAPEGFARQFVEDYIGDMNDKGAATALEIGWDVIYSAFCDYEKDNGITL